MNDKEILKLNIKKTSSPITKKKRERSAQASYKYILIINTI